MADNRIYGQHCRALVRPDSWDGARFTLFVAWDNPSQDGAGWRVSMLTRMETEEYAEGDAFGSRLPTVPRELLQALVDACWSADIKPQAMRSRSDDRHLEDMRAIVAKKLDLKLP